MYVEKLDVEAERESELSNITKGERSDGGAIALTHHITLLNSDGQSPLQLAVALKGQPPEVNYYDDIIALLQGKTNEALMEAVIENDEAAVKAAVEAGAKIDKKVIKALLVKEATVLKSIIQCALKAGVSLLGGAESPLQLVLNLKQRQSSLAVQHMRLELQRATDQKLLQATNVAEAREALDAGADICAVDEEGKSALQLALQRSAGGGAGAGAGGDAERVALRKFLKEKTLETLKTAIAKMTETASWLRKSRRRCYSRSLPCGC